MASLNTRSREPRGHRTRRRTRLLGVLAALACVVSMAACTPPADGSKYYQFVCNASDGTTYWITLHYRTGGNQYVVYESLIDWKIDGMGSGQLARLFPTQNPATTSTVFASAPSTSVPTDSLASGDGWWHVDVSAGAHAACSVSAAVPG